MSKARQQYFADETTLQKRRREFAIEDNVMSKINDATTSIETIRVNWTPLVPDQDKAVDITIPLVEDSLTSTSSVDALSAWQWKILYDMIVNHTNGRFLSNRNCATWLPVTNPETDPYVYMSWDYYVVSAVSNGGTNYRPTWSAHTIWVASTDVETETVTVGDFYFYDWTIWNLQSASAPLVDSSLSLTSRNPVENRVVTAALNWKLNYAQGNTAPTNPTNGMIWYYFDDDWFFQRDWSNWRRLINNWVNKIFDNSVVEIGAWSHGQWFDSSWHHVTIDPAGSVTTYNATTGWANTWVLDVNWLTLTMNTAMNWDETAVYDNEKIVATDWVTTNTFNFFWTWNDKIARLSDIAGKANVADVLTLTNTTAYTPTANYHPATKKYVDDSVSAVDEFEPGNVWTTWQVLKKTANGYEWANETPGWVTSVNSQTWAVVLDADDISDANTTNKFVTATEKSSWDWKQSAFFTASSLAPSNPSAWDQWYDTTNNVTKYYDGSAWQTVAKQNVILSYGSSTWADFTAAYASNSVIYCKATVNSNPIFATLSYVDNVSNPTEVRFQYYLNVNTHSASQQGDQVVIYKLWNSGTWGSITKETMVNVDVSTWLSRDYNVATNKLTLTNTLPFNPDNSGTAWQVIKKTANGYEWANESGWGGGWIQLSPDSPIQLDYIWAGYEDDYANISAYDATTAYLVIEWNNPGFPTPYAQWLLNNSYSDEIWSNDLTSGTGNSWWTLPDGSTKYLQFSLTWGDSYAAALPSSMNSFWATNHDFTMSAWVYNTTDPYEGMVIYTQGTWSNQFFSFCNSSYNWSWNNWVNVTWASGTVWVQDTINTWAWYFYTVTYEYSTGSVKCYLNGQQIWTTQTASSSWNAFSGWDKWWIGRDYHSSWQWGFSDVALYDEILTDTQIASYYDNTKSIYGIS